MKKGEFLRILKSYREGMATEEELRFIESYYDLFETEPDLETWLGEEKTAEIKDQVLDRIRTEIKMKEQEVGKGKVVRLYPYFRKIAAAVAVILALGLVVYFIRKSISVSNKPVAENIQSQNVGKILPGGNRAVLILSNGKKIFLDNTQNGAVTKQGNTQVIKVKSGVLAYTHQPALLNQPLTIPPYNTIATPRGGKYEIVLPDGSKVWLNATSSLRFPVAFTGSTRTVNLKGEGYFEIARQADKPFIVKVDGEEIKVLGTNFNVNAYDDRSHITTTLADGSIKVSDRHQSYILKPGEQARLNKQTENIEITHANIEEALAWKNDMFYFDGTNIKNIMQEIGRWYNVDVVYKTDQLGNKNYSGIISRYSDVKTVLERFSLTGTVQFKIEGRTIVVMN